MLDFLFITSPTNARNPHPPYYFMYLASYLRDRGCSVKIVDMKGGDRPNDIEKHIQKISDIVAQTPTTFTGLASFHSDYDTLMHLGEIIKHQQPTTTLLVGNAHATITPKDFIYKDSPFNIAVIGEGEETCWELYLQKTKQYITIGDVKGIAYMSYVLKEPEYVQTDKRGFINLDSLSCPAYDLVDMGYYLQPQKLIIRRVYTSMICIFAGRGCPFDCDFCAANVVWKANKGKACRLRSVRKVIGELCYLKNHHDIDFFYLFDDMFGMNKKWMNEWFDAKSAIFEYKETLMGKYESMMYSNNKHIIESIPYACQTRADVATEEMVRGLKETGCIQLDIGVEAGTQGLLDMVNKKITLNQIRQVFAWCRKYKIRSFATMLLNLPSESKEDLRKTEQFLKEIKPTAGLIFGVTTPYPGTKIYETYCKPPLKKEEYGLLINNRLNPSGSRFRMCSHKLDLWKLLDKWNLKFRVNPFFERMWCLHPFQKLYWKALFNSTRKKQYLFAWLKDIPKTFLLCFTHKFNIYRWLKKIQYGGKWK